FTNLVVELCHQHDKFYLSINSPTDFGNEAVTLPFEPDRGDHTFLGTVSGLPIRLAVDSGSSCSVSLNPSDWKRAFPTPPPKSIPYTLGSFSGQEATSIVARLPLLRIGKLSYTNLI